MIDFDFPEYRRPFRKPTRLLGMELGFCFRDEFGCERAGSFKVSSFNESDNTFRGYDDILQKHWTVPTEAILRWYELPIAPNDRSRQYDKKQKEYFEAKEPNDNA